MQVQGGGGDGGGGGERQGWIALAWVLPGCRVKVRKAFLRKAFSRARGLPLGGGPLHGLAARLWKQRMTTGCIFTLKICFWCVDEGRAIAREDI